MLREEARLQKNRFGLCLGIVMVWTCLWGSVNAGVVKKEETKKFDVGDFSFTTEKKRDPFEPAYLLRVKREKIVKAEGKKGFELDELKFVGTLKTDKGRSAMMEDMQGKGMLFKKGDFVNSNLWVLEVLENRLVLGYKLKNETRKINIDITKK